MNTRESVLLDVVGAVAAIVVSVVAALYFGQFTTVLGQIILYVVAGALVVASLPGLASVRHLVRHRHTEQQYQEEADEESELTAQAEAFFDLLQSRGEAGFREQSPVNQLAVSPLLDEFAIRMAYLSILQTRVLETRTLDEAWSAAAAIRPDIASEIPEVMRRVQEQIEKVEHVRELVVSRLLYNEPEKLQERAEEIKRLLDSLEQLTKTDVAKSDVDEDASLPGVSSEVTTSR